MEQQQIPIRASDKDLKGRFANAARLSHEPEHFVIDFLFVQPPAAQIVSRIVTTPGHMKSLAQAIGTQLKEYEKKFGKVQPEEPKQKFGFTDEK